MYSLDKSKAVLAKQANLNFSVVLCVMVGGPFMRLREEYVLIAASDDNQDKP